tara:strand:- start:51 stop:1298 length:1248 start_codon:yes stop_codon:yes gene_type:complete
MGYGGGAAGLAVRSATGSAGFAPFGSSETFSYTGSDQSWSVPAGTSKIGFFVWGASGGTGGGSPLSANWYKTGGAGGYTEGIVSVTGGETLWIVVGQGGVIGNTSPRVYGGGGKGGHTNRGAGEWGVSGGGLSGIFAAPGPVGSDTMPTGSIPKAIAIAGGGGGFGLNGTNRNVPAGYGTLGAMIPAPLGGWMWPGGPNGAQAPEAIDPTGVTQQTSAYHAAGGGGLRGENSSGGFWGSQGNVEIRNPKSGSPYSSPGQPIAGGGSQNAGGRGVDGIEDGEDGSALNGGNGGEAGWEYAGGGGGGGWYGGGGGGADWPSAWNPGGGGSGFIGNATLQSANDEEDTWSGPSPHNSRDYEIAFTRCATRLTSAAWPNGVPAYSSPNSSPYMPTTAGFSPAAQGDWAAGNPGYIVILY